MGHQISLSSARWRFWDRWLTELDINSTVLHNWYDFFCSRGRILGPRWAVSWYQCRCILHVDHSGEYESLSPSSSFSTFCFQFFKLAYTFISCHFLTVTRQSLDYFFLPALLIFFLSVQTKSAKSCTNVNTIINVNAKGELQLAPNSSCFYIQSCILSTFFY